MFYTFLPIAYFIHVNDRKIIYFMSVFKQIVLLQYCRGPVKSNPHELVEERLLKEYYTGVHFASYSKTVKPLLDAAAGKHSEHSMLNLPSNFFVVFSTLAERR